MKRLILVLALLGAVVSASFAQEAGQSAAYSETEKILSRGKLNNKKRKQIAEFSAGLTVEEREDLYASHSFGMNTAAPAMLLNLLPFGFGSSFIQRDALGGGIILGAEALGTVILTAGIIDTFFVAPAQLAAARIANDNARLAQIGARLQRTYVIGGVIMGAGYLFGFIRPWWYMASYNKKLKNALQITARDLGITTQFAITPSALSETHIALSLFSVAY